MAFSQREIELIDILLEDTYVIANWKDIAVRVKIEAPDLAQIQLSQQAGNYRDVFRGIWTAYKQQGKGATVENFVDKLKGAKMISAAERIEDWLATSPMGSQPVITETDAPMKLEAKDENLGRPRSRHPESRPPPQQPQTIPTPFTSGNELKNQKEPQPRRGNKSSSRKSEVDPMWRVSEDVWVLSLIRRPKSKHPLHTFIVLEGIEDGHLKTFFFELVAQTDDPLKMLGTNPGRIQLDVVFGKRDEFEEPLLHLGLRPMMKLGPKIKVTYVQWQISSETGRKLIENVLKSWKNPQIFTVVGEPSVFAQSSAILSNGVRGHNCYTWAASQIEKLHDIDPTITLPKEGEWLQKIITIPSMTLNDNWKKVFKGNALTLVIMLVVQVLLYAIYRYIV